MVSALLAAVVSFMAAAPDLAAQKRDPSALVAPPPMFRVSREPVAGGAELLTVLGRVEGAGDSSTADSVPLLSILRDTLDDADAENDQLRYVWVHGYTTPSAGQRIASAIPFLNRRAGNKDPERDDSVPPAIIDLSDPEHDVWKNVMWIAAQSLLFDPYGVLVKTSVRAFRRNGEDYRKAHIVRALAVLALYEAETGVPPALSPVEMRDIQARLVLAQRPFAGIVNDGYLEEAYKRESADAQDVRGHNWELLRQRCEEEGLYFDPLSMPDGTATHALVWVARHDVDQSGRRFEKRFLNFASPWGDKRLLDWTGYSETRYFDTDGRRVAPDTPGATPVELIPLGLYGLDHPKIPALLIDFRDQNNPKRREVSRRLLNDITRNVLSLSPFGDIHYFLARSVYGFVTGRRGMDINQPSRLRSYSMLKLLLSLDASLNPELSAEIGKLVERVSMNPLQNDGGVEVALAYRSYDTLLGAAREPSGEIAERLKRDRADEFTRLEHGAGAPFIYKLGTILSAGMYRHREKTPPDSQLARIDLSRRLAFHRRFLEEVVRSTPVVEVGWDIRDVRRSVGFLAEQGRPGDGKNVKLAFRVFERTQDRETRRLCLNGLARAGSPAAREMLARISKSPDVDPDLRALALQANSAPRADPVRRAAGTVLAAAADRR
jgi:hypothetical protein